MPHSADLNTLLAQWHADPVPEAQALSDLRSTEAHYRQSLRDGGDTFYIRWRLMVSRYWVGRSIATDCLELGAAARSDGEKALVALTHGQLLVSRRVQEGLKFLEEGFRLAVPYLSASAYPKVSKRHRSLARLPLGSQPQAPSDLQNLLLQARVIERLEGGQPQQPKTDRDRVEEGRKDTLG